MFNNNFWRNIITIPDNVDSGTVKTFIPSTNSYLPQGGESLVMTNTIRLSEDANPEDNYYVGFDILLKQTQENGTTYTQKKRIVGYDGSERIAVIDDIWESGREPKQGDSYSIVLSYPDQRVSINPIMQTVDYITSYRYGRDLSVEEDIRLDTAINAAKKCDARSDVSLKLLSETTVNAGDVYRLTEGSNLIWEGTVRSDDTSRYILFTDVIGKITNKWNSWKAYKSGEILYLDNRFYKVSSGGVKSVEPVHTSGTINGLQAINALSITRFSGQGPSSLLIDISENPVIALNEEGVEISGYTLYDSDSISYWRRIGWDEHSQDSATLYQTNFTIDTSNPMFDNINMMFEHCNGIFSYSQGKYKISIEEAETEFLDVQESDVIGKITFGDEGNKSAFNSVSVSYFDPSNNFESKNISLFSDRFLKQDKNVPKKGNITIVGMTNYYNVRLIADTYLKKSRFNSTITVTLFPEFLTLEAGSVFQFTHKRFRWFEKKFRVRSITINEDGTVTVVASEYNDSFYALTNMNNIEGVGDRNSISYTSLERPTNLKATNTVTNNELKDGIMVTWDNASGLKPTVSTEIHVSDTNNDQLIITTVSNNQVTFSSNHGLLVGSMLRAESGGNGIIKGGSYFVRDVINLTTVTLSENYKGEELALTNGTGREILMNPFTMVGLVPYPGNSYLHSFPDIVKDTKKYYRIRYRVGK